MIGVLAALGIVGGTVAAGAVACRPPRRNRSGDNRLHKLADGVWCYRGFFSNSAALALGGEITVVDTQITPETGLRLRRRVDELGAGPIRSVVNTHYHGDHTGGNAAFADVEILTGAQTARFIVERDEERYDYANTFGLLVHERRAIAPPTRTFVDETTIERGGSSLRLFHAGPVETEDAIVVHWPERAVLLAGDGVATEGYPYTGVPFLDEGLRGDGAWVAYLKRLRALDAEVLIPGHGKALVGKRAIRARLDLLAALFDDLIGEVRAELARGTKPAEVAPIVDARLARWRRRKDLTEHVVSQRFALYRCINSLVPERAGGGWWHDLRPSVIRRAQPAAVDAALARGGSVDPIAHAHALRGKDAGLALSLVERVLEASPDDARAHATRAEILVDMGFTIRPFVDSTECFSAAAASARRALATSPDEPFALLALGALETWSSMIIGQSFAVPIARIERALASGALDAAQRRKAWFFLAKAHQFEERDDDCDRCFTAALPAVLRPLYPALRARLRATP